MQGERSYQNQVTKKRNADICRHPKTFLDLKSGNVSDQLIVAKPSARRKQPFDQSSSTSTESFDFYDLLFDK
jgi:hypothetical protein